MVVRTKIVVRIIAISIVVINMIYLVEKSINHSPFTLRDWLALLFFPFLFYIGVLMTLTMRIRFFNEGISVYWKVGFGPINLWEQTKYHLNWHEVDRVYSPYPVWIPIHAIGVIGYQDSRKMRNFYLGALMTKKKESLVYIAKHVRAGVIDKEVQKLIAKYENQLKEPKAHAS